MRSAIGVCAALILTQASGTCLGAQPSHAATAQVQPGVRIPSAALAADFAKLRQAFESLHPGLYRYNTKEQMDAHFAQLESAFAKDLTRPEAFLALSVFAAKIKCGHTFPNPFNQSEAVINELCAGQDRVPFCFRWINRRMIVTRDFSGQLSPGTEVLSINGQQVGDVLDRLMSIARADGGNDAKRIQLLEVSNAERFEAFDLYFPLLFPLSRPAFDLSIREVDGTSNRQVTVAAMTRAAREALVSVRSRQAEGVNDPLWELSPIEDGVAVLPMPSWVAYKTKWDWEGFINRTFDALIEQNVQTLVIDLRGNEGGSSVGDVLLARLIEQPVPRSVRQRFVRYQTTPASLDSILDTWDSQFRNWGREALGPMDLSDRRTGLSPGTTGGYYRLRNQDGSDPDEADQMIPPRGPVFRGRLFVLIDSSNSSATFEFASRIKSLGLGTLIGQPTGGNQRGINGGAFFFVRLPGSGLEIDLPIMAQFLKDRTTLAPDEGITPDVLVIPTQADIQSGADPEMREVRRLIRSAK